MKQKKDKNIASFNHDALHGTYKYYSEKLSSRLANERIDAEIEKFAKLIGVSQKNTLDIGSGDGTTALLLCRLGAKTVVGVDPAENAVFAAQKRCEETDASQGKTAFLVADIERFSTEEHFDLAVFSRVIHHLPNPSLALKKAAELAPEVLIIEPNGWNPAVKLIEKLSTYHREHGEKSYTARKLRRWCTDAGYEIKKLSYINLVPMFCPDWMARVCKIFEHVVEKTPFLRNILSGQCIIFASKKIDT